MPTKSIFLTGGTGFVGSAVLDALLARGHHVQALVRERSLDRAGVTTFRGDLFDIAAINAAMKGCDTVVHLVGIIRENKPRGQTFERIHVEAAANVARCASSLGAKRFIHMSALGASLESQSTYARTKAKAEAFLRSTDLDWTILQPSIIHGPRGDFMQQVAGWAYGKLFPKFYMPYFGVGLVGNTSKLLQPVFVGDVAHAVCESLDRPDTIGKTIPLVGADRLDWPALYAIVSTALLGKPKLAVGHPVWYGKLVTHLAPASWLPFNHSQVAMAGEDSVADPQDMRSLLGIEPVGFKASFESYVEEMKRVGAQ